MISYHILELMVNTPFRIILAILILLPATLLFYAPFHQGNYDFHIILKTIIMSGSLILLLISYGYSETRYMIGYAAMAVIFNVLIPFKFNSTVWVVIDIVAAVYWVIAYRRVYDDLISLEMNRK